MSKPKGRKLVKKWKDLLVPIQISKEEIEKGDNWDNFIKSLKEGAKGHG